MSAVVGFIGCGKMGGALARAFVVGGAVKGADLVLCDIDAETASSLAADLGGRTVPEPTDLVAACDVVVLAVKPQHLPQLLPDLAAVESAPEAWVSIAAGVSIAALRRGLPKGAIIRTMPNRPALVAAGVTALMGDAETSDDTLGLVVGLFETAGETVVLDDETLFDAVTALSGSGPAFVFRLIEGLIEGGRREGLEPDVARALAVSTVLGAGKLLHETGTDPGDERVAVSSPGGTTLAGLASMGEARFFDAVIGAVRAAAARSRELGAQRRDHDEPDAGGGA